jgi:hypothetical protein|tara:strand:- start:109 stop:291 length:183 start_codon:yes stop_codon:yes gene_type:complete
MLDDYEKKDVAKAPVVKSNDLPEGWVLYQKRERWCVRNPEGKLFKFASKSAAEMYIEEIS